MSDIDDLAASYRNHEKALAEANAINKGTLFDALARAGIARVNVTFDGEGDSGQVESIVAGDGAELPDITIELQQARWGTGKLDGKKVMLREAIETLCYDYLSQEHGGWENDGGAYGEFIFDVSERTVDLVIEVRFTDSTCYNHSF